MGQYSKARPAYRAASVVPLPGQTVSSNMHRMGLLVPREPVPADSQEWSRSDDHAFRALQEKLRDVWPTITMRTLARANRTALIVPSISFEVPDSLIPVFPAYEERFLYFVLLLLRQPGSTAIYLTSQPVLPRLIDYYFQLVPELNSPDVRQRLFLVSPVDGSPRPLTGKILARPRVIERIRRLIPDPGRALIFPFNTSPLEAELGRRLDVPVYGPNPSLAHFGTKSGSRHLFREEGVPHPPGVEDVDGPDAIVAAIDRIRAGRPVFHPMSLCSSQFSKGRCPLSVSPPPSPLPTACRGGKTEHFKVSLFLA